VREMIEDTIWFIVVTIVLITIVVSCSGCRFAQSAVDFVFKPAPSTNVEQPVSSTGQLWKTVKKSNWITTLAIPIIALGAVAMFNGAIKLGMSAVIFGTVNLFMALATARFALWMAIFGLIGSIASVAVSIIVKNRGLLEIVTGAQILKNSTIKTKKEGSKILKDCQTKNTQKLVQKIKSKMKVKGK